MTAHELDTGRCLCGEPLPPRGSRGPRAQYCSARCRNRASRQRRSSFQVPVPIESREPVAAYLAGSEAPTDDQVLGAVMEATALAGVLHRLGRQARGPFAWRCEKLAAAIDAELATFGTTG